MFPGKMYMPKVMQSLPLPNIDEITNVVDMLKLSSAGHDEIKTSLVKEVKSSIAGPLTHIFSLSLESGVMPQDLKIAKVTPIFKGDDTSSFINYHQISILPCFSNVYK